MLPEIAGISQRDVKSLDSCCSSIRAILSPRKFAIPLTITSRAPVPFTKIDSVAGTASNSVPLKFSQFFGERSLALDEA